MSFITAEKDVVGKGDKVFISQEGYDFLISRKISPKEYIRGLWKKYLGNVGAMDGVFTLFFYCRI